ncbi:MAG: DUF4388 domain-containing protein [Acidobacteria bacterium]|nr:DUF4388 domain-containing protein [Acidobacteriota bacterium]
MQGARFLALTGHLNEHSLADLIGLLRHQRKTGRLLIEYAVSPCSLYFLEGNLVDAQLNTMGGLQAVLVALSQPNAAFNFNPLIQPPRRSINESSQKVILELLGCWEEKTIEVEAQAVNDGTPVHEPLPMNAATIDVQPEPLPKAREVLALPASSLEQATLRRQRKVLVASAVISLVVSFLTVGALARWLIKRDIAAALTEIAERRQPSDERSGAAGTQGETIKVVVQVEKGRVSQAYVEERRSGLEAYEALALKIARERRYPSGSSGRDIVPITIKNPH